MLVRYNKTLLGAGLAALFNLASAATPGACPALSKEIVESGRNFRACVTGSSLPSMNCSQYAQRQFDNVERVLPKAGAGQSYQEGKISLATVPGKGQMRWVFLSQQNGGKPAVMAQYFTSDHYMTFCKFDK